MIKITDSPDIKKWDEFIYNHPRGNIFHSSYIVEVYRKTKNYEPVTLAAIDTSSNEVLALISAVIVKESSGFLGSFTSRAIMQGGPLYVDNEAGKEAVNILLDTFDKIVGKKVIYTQVRNMWKQDDISSTFEEAGYTYKEHLNYLIDLNRSVDDVWSDIHKSRRKGINRAKKNGVEITKVTDIKCIEELYEIIYFTYKNVGLPLADLSLFESAFKLLSHENKVQFYGAKQNNKYIGVRVVFTFKGLIYDWYAGSRNNNCYVNEALVWHVLEEGAISGNMTFDFGGAGSPNEEYGVREFKSRFGGKLTNYGRYQKVYSPYKMKCIEKSMSVYKKITTIM